MSTDPSLRAPALAAFAAPVAGYGILLGSWLIPATSAGLLGALVAGAVALAVSVVLVATIPVRAIADLVESRLRPTLPSGRFHGAASDISVSLGASGHLLIQESPSFDVAGLPTSRRDVVVVSTGAFDVLTRREVVALASARLAALREPWCRAATLGTLAWWSLRFVLPFGLLGFVFGAPALGIAAAALLPLVFVLGDRIVWLRDRCVDLAAIERAVDPGGLAGAVRRVSGLGRRVDDHAADPSSPSLRAARRLIRKCWFSDCACMMSTSGWTADS